MKKIILPATFPVTCHTRSVGPGSTFVAIQGYNEDGVAYIPQALEKGAKIIVVQKQILMQPELLKLIADHNATLEYCDEDPRLELAKRSAQAAGYPARKLKILGITGTKGKTTSAFLLHHMLTHAGHKVALLSTVKNIIDGQEFAMQLTTPQPDYLQQFFKLCVEHAIEYLVMEVAAQALSLYRVHDVFFDGIIFTNIDQEHAEFYPTMDEYIAAKFLLFKHTKPGAPRLINADDQRIMEQIHAGSSLAQECTTFGMHQADVIGTLLNDASHGIELAVNINSQQPFTLRCPALIGSFNAYNLLGVVALARSLGIAPALLDAACRSFQRVPGRLEQYALSNGSRCIIDYAHNPSSYEAVLSMLRQATEHLIVVFGCGGDRDRTKRPIMGSLAAKYGDTIILTSDNPRSESPAAIIEDIKKGISAEYRHKIIEELDREKAIEKAYQCTKPGSIMVLLGKGPDEYQIVGTLKTRFSEAEIVRRFQKEM